MIRFTRPTHRVWHRTFANTILYKFSVLEVDRYSVFRKSFHRMKRTVVSIAIIIPASSVFIRFLVSNKYIVPYIDGIRDR